MSFEEVLEATVRRVVREELRAALSEGARRSGIDDRRVTAAEAAAAAGLASSTVQAWAKAGKIQSFGEGRAVRYSLAEVLAVRPAPKTLETSISERAAAIRRQHG